jgi:hypothetical protein
MSYVLDVLCEISLYEYKEPTKVEDTKFGSVYINPSKRHIKGFMDDIPEDAHHEQAMRMIRDKHHNMYAWNAYEATHTDMMHHLGIKSGHLSVATYKDLVDNHHNLHDVMDNVGYSTIHGDDEN